MDGSPRGCNTVFTSAKGGKGKTGGSSPIAVASCMANTRQMLPFQCSGGSIPTRYDADNSNKCKPNGKGLEFHGQQINQDASDVRSINGMVGMFLILLLLQTFRKFATTNAMDNAIMEGGGCLEKKMRERKEERQKNE